MPKGKRHSAKFKFKVALEAAKGSKSLADGARCAPMAIAASRSACVHASAQMAGEPGTSSMSTFCALTASTLTLAIHRVSSLRMAHCLLYTTSTRAIMCVTSPARSGAPDSDLLPRLKGTCRNAIAVVYYHCVYYRRVSV